MGALNPLTAETFWLTASLLATHATAGKAYFQWLLGLLKAIYLSTIFLSI